MTNGQGIHVPVDRPSTLSDDDETADVPIGASFHVGGWSDEDDNGWVGLRFQALSGIVLTVPLDSAPVLAAAIQTAARATRAGMARHIAERAEAERQAADSAEHTSGAENT